MRTFLMLAVTALLLSACATISSKKKSSTFEMAMYNYSKAIRWSEFALADSMRRLPEGRYATQSVEQLEHIRVTSYETLNTSGLEDETGVRVTARIVYYHDDGMKLNSLLDNQLWKYDEDNHSWYITTPLPVFK